MHSALIGAVAFVAAFGGALAGLSAARILPPPHLNDETRAAVAVTMTVVGTLTALALGLMINSANTIFTTKSDGVASLAVEIVKLDRALRRYGPETLSAREALQTYVRAKTSDLSEKKPSPALGIAVLRLLETVDDRLLALKPGDERQTHLKGDALELIHTIADSRWTLVEKADASIASPFLWLLIFWLFLLFGSFGLFAPNNGTVITVLFFSGLAIAGAVFIILELGSPAGYISIPLEPMNAALKEMSQPD